MKDVPLPKFRLSLLARFELSGPDGPVDLPNKKLAGLLAYLACTAPVPQSREKLATLLWGSHFETQAHQNLRQALFRLRRSLGHDAVISDGDEVWLAPGVIACDVAQLEALVGEGSRDSLAAAADLYQEPLLADVTIGEEAWTDWLAAERPRLEGLALDAMIAHAEQALQAGNAESALKAANRAIAVNALREDAHRLVVQALAAAGRKPEAIKHYQDLVALLKRELNTEPDAATKSLVADLGSAQPPARSPNAGESAKPAPPQPDWLSLPDKPSIAVLAFQNMSGDPEQEYFSDGISEDIITGLSKISGLMVIARNSSFTYKGKAVDIRAIGRDLGVRCVLEGSVRRAGNRVRITAQLIDASDGAHLWAERFDRELSDLFWVQDDVTSQIINALKVTLSPAERTRLAAGGTRDIKAYDHLLRGREFLLGATKTRETFERATTFFAMALESDPNYSQAYAGLGWAYVFDYQNRWSDDPDNSLQLAKQNVARAIEADPNEPLAHVTASIVATYERDLDRSKAEADIALILNPNCTEAYACLGQVCTFSGRPLEAIPMLEHAMRLDPAYIQQYLHLLGVANVLAGRFETAASVLRQRILLVPGTDFSRAVLASALGHLGEIDEAGRIWRELKEINPRYTFSGHFGRQPFKNKDDVRRIADGIAKAGLSSVADLGGTRPSMEHDAEAAAERDDAALSVMAVRSASPERRQLTIMVCNIVGSMQLSAQLDPEDMLDLVAAFHKAVATAVSQFDGHIARYLGDGVHVYFGYPKADEHDAEQAVRAGLAIAGGVGTLKAPAGVTLQASVGIATGLVVVAGWPETAEALQRVAIGEAPNVAAQLQELASPGEVVIATSTQRLVGRMFDCRALAADEAKGLEAWQVRGETAGVTRFHARRSGALSPLVGRQEESELLLRRWHQAKLREGRVVLISGEPGIGKSRIAENLLARLAGESEPHVRLRYFCSPHHRHSPLYPFIAQLEQAASFPPGSDAEARLDRLDAMLRPTSKNLPRDAALIAELLGVPADGRYPALTVTPQQKREMTLAAILDQLEGVAAQRPVVIVVEDVHWIDPTSLDLLSRTVARIANLPVLLVMTFRPEFQPTWVGEANVSLLPLSRLGRRESTALIGGITQGKALPGAVVEQVLSRTDGVPLFIEELTSMLLESGVLRETADGYALDGPLPELAIPTTLQASLVARLDRLVMIEDVAQIGATIGREFSYELIAAVSALAPKDLDVALERLTTSGLISRRGMPPDASYSFKHALVRDAAYATLLKSRRRQLHASIAKALVEQFPATVESLPEVAAHHFTEAALAPEAIDHWVKAGRLMHARSANREAVTCFEQALDLLKELPETVETLEQAVDVRLDLKNSLHPLGAVDPIIDHLRDAEGPARTLGDQRRLGRLFVHMCHALEIAGRPIEAIAYGQKALALVESLADVPLQVLGNLYLGAACHGTGDYRRAEDVLLRVLRLLESEPGRDRIDVPGFPAVQAHGYLTRLFIAQGRFEQASVHGHEGIRLAEALNHPYSMSAACWILAWLEISRGELRHAVGLLERGLAPALEWNLNYVSAADTGALGYAYALLGRTAEGLPMLERALATFENMKHRSGELQFLLLLGEACVLTDRLADALKFARRALTHACERGLRNQEARALWLLGEAASHSDSPEHADRHYRDALALAEPRGMRPLVAHCHLGLGKLHRRTGKSELAQEHVAKATTMYREMNMSFWLEQAEADAGTP